ncbi:MAG: F0F1 ATP synthase subunit A [Chloroflexi bacterium]|nr:F0F1 ATP synthase subunit A [Chloroflexota bacterium]
MSTLLRRPKTLAVLVVAGVVFIVSLAGGALGNEFGGGFLASPIAHIQLPAESITSGSLFADFQITNTMVTTWLAILFLVVISVLATRRLKDVPTGLQNVVEIVIEGFLNLAESVAGPGRARKFFPLIMTIFLFIVTANWMGILPGFGTIGRIEPAEEVVHHLEESGDEVDLADVRLQLFDGDGSFAVVAFGSVDDEITALEVEEHGVKEGQQAGLLVPFLRSANTDVNMTLAIALVAMTMIHFWGFSTLGFFGHMGKFVNFKQGPIGLFVGLLEAISEVARVISFTFRLFGNMFAGEVLLVAMAFLLPLIGIIPFLGLELFVGVIQAFIFSMLTLVFATMATVSHGAEEH